MKQKEGNGGQDSRLFLMGGYRVAVGTANICAHHKEAGEVWFIQLTIQLVHELFFGRVSFLA